MYTPSTSLTSWFVPRLSSRARHRDTSAAGTLVSLRRHNHVIKRAHGHAGILPRIEEVARGHRAAGALVASDRPVLVERLRAVDGRGIGPRRLVEVVGAAVRVDGALGLGARCRAGVVFAKVLEDVVLNKRGTGPSVDAEVLGGGLVFLSISEIGEKEREENK